jgi:hypothetical protein
MAPTTATPTPATPASTANAPSTRSSKRRQPPEYTPTPSQGLRPRKSRINWTFKMEEAMLQALMRAVRRGLCTDSSYKKEG